MAKKPDYKTYREWKGWGPENCLEPWLARYFSKEFSRLCLSACTSVLEIGFGHGKFLKWTKSQSIFPVVVGLEIIPELVEFASKQGFEVYNWDIVEGNEDQSPVKGRKFDCIVAFDVLEHLMTGQAQYVLNRISKLLSPKGKVILRFPNGESPFCLPLQNGDYTHKITITKSKLEHLCIGTGLQLESYRNSARVANKPLTAPIKWLFFRIRDLVEIFIGYVYYNRRIPLDPAATAILCHK
jgi:2-polyprenyl-3-methyl-5-hydroxy-6-metoxy-1,4-benzoquinol methylase